MVTSLVMKSLSLWMSCSTILIPIAKTVLCYTLIWYVLLWGLMLYCWNIPITWQQRSVLMKTLTENYITVSGKKYIICDPTYIGASIGLAMSQFKNVAAKVLKYLILLYYEEY